MAGKNTGPKKRDAMLALKNSFLGLKKSDPMIKITSLESTRLLLSTIKVRNLGESKSLIVYD